MSELIRSAGPLKVEIRLQQALDRFVRDLDTDGKSEFLRDQANCRASLPNCNDVLRFMGQLSTKAPQSNFGPRAESILRGTQHFAAIGDILIGGSQNLIACGVWTVIRFTLQAAVGSRKLLDKISDIFMVAGRTMPRHEGLSRLYERNPTKLHTYYYEYFLALVEMCCYLFKFVNKSALSRAVLSLSDTELDSFQSQLSNWSSLIKDETIFLMAQGMEESLSRWRSMDTISKSEKARRLAKGRARILNGCSTYPYEATWKRLRKKGSTRLFEQVEMYEPWATSTELQGNKPKDEYRIFPYENRLPEHTYASTLILTGGLGSGKSVLAANMVEDLASKHMKETPVTYFFCEYQNIKSTTASVIIGSLARQILQSIPFELPADSATYVFPLRGTDDIIDLLIHLVPKNQSAYCVLDGLYECEREVELEVLSALSTLQKKFSLQICLTYRLEVRTKRDLPSEVKGLHIAKLPNNTSDLEEFIGNELERCVESELLTLGDPTLIEDIFHTLTRDAKGMFLWADLQISALCWARNDKEIRHALGSLPKDLAETFKRLLYRAASHNPAGHENQSKILSNMAAAARPFTQEELADLLGVVPFEAVWSLDQRCTNIDAALACCGSFITVDEELLSVHFVHSSAMKFLVLHQDSATSVNIENAHRALSELTVTYLKYSIFQTDLAKGTPKLLFQASDAPSNIIQSSLSAGTGKVMSLKLLKALKTKNVNKDKETNMTIDLDQISNTQHEQDNFSAAPFKSNATAIYPFYSYASEFWAYHTDRSTNFSKQHMEFLSKTARKHLRDGKPLMELTHLMGWAFEHDRAVAVLVLDRFLDEPNMAYYTHSWIKECLGLRQEYDFKTGTDHHTKQGTVPISHRRHIDSRLQYYCYLSIFNGRKLALDFFLYRAACRDELSRNFVTRCAMMAAYRDECEMLSYLVSGDCRGPLTANREDDDDARRAEIYRATTLSGNIECMTRLRLWVSLFGGYSARQTLRAVATSPAKWLECIELRIGGHPDVAFQNLSEGTLDTTTLQIPNPLHSGHREVPEKQADLILNMDMAKMKEKMQL